MPHIKTPSADKRTQRVQRLKELYKDHISPEHMDILCSIAVTYNGTLLANAVQDAYWLLVYGDEPYGPDGKPKEEK
jgi:hypothetical protein